MSGNDQNATSAAELFDLLWESLADVLGTAATATLLRRAIKSAACHPRGPSPWSWPASAWTEYLLPEPWKQAGNDEAVSALRVVAAELRVLRVELTGSIVITRLGRLAPFRKWRIDFSDGARND